jgi:hypothetical protein
VSLWTVIGALTIHAEPLFGEEGIDVLDAVKVMTVTPNAQVVVGAYLALVERPCAPILIIG